MNPTAFIPLLGPLLEMIFDKIGDDVPDEIEPILGIFKSLLAEQGISLDDTGGNAPGLIEEGKKLKRLLRMRLYTRTADAFPSDKDAIGVLSDWISKIDGSPSIEDYEALLTMIEEKDIDI